MEKLKSIFKNINKRTIKYGSISISLTVVVIAIAVLVNLLVGSLPSIFNTTFRLDLTPNKLYSLGDVSKDILQNLEREVTIYGLFDDAKIGSDSDYEELIALLEQYNSYPKVAVEYVDPDKNPGFLKNIDPESINDIKMGDFVVLSGSKLRKLSKSDLIQSTFNQQTFSMVNIGSNAEQSFTGAIKYVSAAKTPVLYFTEGHGEENINNGYEIFKQYMSMNNYDIKTLSLLTEQSVPEDADIMMVMSPKEDLLEEEKDKIRDYLDGGGKAIFMFDSLEEDPEFTQFKNLLAEYNVSLNHDKVKEMDGQRHVPGNPYDILPVMETNEIISEPFNMIVPKSRSLNILKNKKTHLNVTSLLKTSDQAIGEQIDQSRGQDIPGPLDLAISVSYVGDAKPTKLLVLGNASFINDESVNLYGPYSQNGMIFFLTAVNWMQDKSTSVSIAPKMYQQNVLAINAVQARVVSILVIVILPLIILAAGLMVYLRRRHL
ncbi:MAG: GldG family protein [Acetivibrionales bacterium]|jgi:ABC-2 type transport system permease protein